MTTKPHDEWPSATIPSEIFGRRASELRKARKLSQRALVQRVKALGIPINQPGVSRIEAGKQGVSLDEAVAVAAVLGVTPEQLYQKPLAWKDYLVAQAEAGPDERLTPDEARLKTWTQERRKVGRHRARERQPPTKED